MTPADALARAKDLTAKFGIVKLPLELAIRDLILSERKAERERVVNEWHERHYAADPHPGCGPCSAIGEPIIRALGGEEE
jgi:hypothetical protein